MQQHAITMLGAGFIGDFYTTTLHGQRGVDRVRVVYSRSEDRARSFAERWAVPHVTTDMEAAIRHPETDVVVVALPNHLHEEAVKAVAAAGKPVLCTKPLGRNAAEAQRMLEAVEQAGVFAGYLEDLCYTPKTLKAIASVEAGRVGRGARGFDPARRTRARTAPGSGMAATRAAVRSSTWAATASRSSGASWARTTVRSR